MLLEYCSFLKPANTLIFLASFFLIWFGHYERLQNGYEHGCSIGNK